MTSARQLLFFVGVLALVASVAPERASAACTGATCPLGGNMRFQYSKELPIPIGFTPAPVGKIAAITNATVMAGTGTVPSLMFAPGQLFAPAANPPLVVPVALTNSPVFQRETALSASFPRVAATFSAGGRSGPAIATFCPGLNTSVLSGTCPGTPAIPGRMRYTRTANQFGGPAQARFGGSANVALRAGTTAPCSISSGFCLAAFAQNTPPPTLAAGGPFGFFTSVSRPAPNPGLFFVSVTPAGLITGKTSTGIGAGLPNPVTSFGGPWTTGMITISQPSALISPPEVFILTGSDGRISGAGSLSLVAGSLTQRTLFGPSANPAWLNLNVPEPSLSAMIGTGAAILALAGGDRLRRSRRR